MGRSSRKRDSRRRTLGSLAVLGALGLFIALLLVIGSRDRARPSGPPGSASPETIASATERAASGPDRLSRVLAGKADWEIERAGSPPRWEGRLSDSESMIHWNARASAAIEQAGLQVLDATEELIDRRGRPPLQRLQMRIADGGDPVAIVVVETSRSPALPPAF
jgi:hypothetical protein